MRFELEETKRGDIEITHIKISFYYYNQHVGDKIKSISVTVANLNYNQRLDGSVSSFELSLQKPSYYLVWPTSPLIFTA